MRWRKRGDKRAKLCARGAVEHERRGRGLQFGVREATDWLDRQLREAMRRAKMAADDAVRRGISPRAGNHGKPEQSDCREKISGLHQKMKDIDAIVTPNQR
jgi:hypothetical protein